jgi:serine/threonine-protein kinase
VTAASDVYSLGVVLYRLLTGRLPADPADGTVPACDDPAGRSSARSPAPPSRVAVLRGLGRGAVDDLDRVVLMALAPEPDRRYGTARELAEDLERVLAGWPVAAHSAGGVYRARRFVSRHRVATGVAAGLVALLLSALAGLAVSTVQARRERDEARSERLRAERLAELLEQIFETASPATLPASELSARRLVAEASARLESGMDGGDPAIQADLYAALGRIQRRIGEFAESERLLRRAVGLRAAAGDVPALAEDLSDLAESVRENGDFPAAERLHRRALELWRAHLGDDALELTGSLDALSYVLTVLGHHDEARQAAEEALAIRERHFGPDHPEVADSLGKLGNLTLTREDHRAAVDIFRRVVTMGLDEINLLPAQKNLALALLRLGEVDEAEALLREILADEHRLYGEEHPRIAFSLSHLGETMWARGRPEEAESYMRSALDMRRRLLGEDHPAVAVSLTKLADLLTSGGREEEAAEAYRRAITIAREKFGPHSPYLADGLFGLGRLLFAGGDPAAAEPLLREALAIHRDTAPPERIAEAELELARCHAALEDLRAAGGG